MDFEPYDIAFWPEKSTELYRLLRYVNLKWFKTERGEKWLAQKTSETPT